MAITDPSDDIIATTTELARQYLARVFRGELVYRAVGFSVGRGGYNPVAFAAAVDFVTQLSRLRAAYYLMLVMHPVGALPAFAEEYRRLSEERLAQLSGGEVVLAGNAARERVRYRTADE